MELNNSPLFSIIVANYNNGQFLQTCIDSIIAQTYTNWEVIIVDDCSTDNSHELYKIYSHDERIKILYNISNKGVGYTKRKAIEHTSGEFIGIVDPDDAIIPETLVLIINEFQKKPLAAIVHTNHFICDKNLKNIKVANNSGKIPEGESQLSYDGPKIGPFWAFRRATYLLTSGININLRSAEDQDLYYKLEEHGTIDFINKPCYYYRYHDGGISTTNNFFSAYANNITAIKEAYVRRKKNKSKAKNITKAGIAHRYLFYYQNYSIKCIKEKMKLKATMLLLFSLKYLFYDKRLLTLRILYRYIILNKKTE